MKKSGIVFIMVFGIVLCGCGQGNSADFVKDNTINTVKETDGAKKYDEILSENIQINDSNEIIQILQNTCNVRDTRIVVGESDAKMDRISIDAGYSQTDIKTLDCTGDQRDEIILILQGGASGAMNEIQVLTKIKNEWEEIPLPDALWEDDYVVLKEEDQKMFLEIKSTNTKEIVPVNLAEKNEDHGIRYRTCKINKKKEIVVVYEIYSSELNRFIGQVKQTMHYDRDKNVFLYGETHVSFSLK